MVLLTDTLKEEKIVDGNTFNFLDFIGTKFDLDKKKGYVLLSKEGTELFVKDRDSQNEILNLAKKWGGISLKVLSGRLDLGEAHYPIYIKDGNYHTLQFEELKKKHAAVFNDPNIRAIANWYGEDYGRCACGKH